MKPYFFTVVIGFFLLSVTACQPITSLVRMEGTAAEPAVQGARQVLARWLHSDPATIDVISAEATEWPDGCLGVPDPLALCAPGVVPGYAATLQANGQSYTVHTDQGGYRIRVAAAPEPAIGESLITWTGGDSVTGACLEAVLGRAGIGFAPCHLPQIGGKFANPARQAVLNEFVNTFAAFTAETASGDIQFMGQGATVATAEEQQQIAAWAQNAIYEAQAGGPLAWLHYRWLAEAGNVDNAICPDLLISDSGSVTLGVCNGRIESKSLGERAAVDWGEIGDRFAPFTYTTPSESIEFSGMGTISGEAWQRSLLAWARVTYAELNRGTVSAASNTAVSWHLGQQPNKPNTCAHLTVLAYGYAYAEQIACEGGDVVASIGGWLTSEEMARLDRWLYQRAAFYQENNYIDGRGTVPLSAAKGSEAAQWAADLYARLDGKH